MLKVQIFVHCTDVQYIYILNNAASEIFKKSASLKEVFSFIIFAIKNILEPECCESLLTLLLCRLSSLRMLSSAQSSTNLMTVSVVHRSSYEVVQSSLYTRLDFLVQRASLTSWQA
jgi:hypothetical protein